MNSKLKLINVAPVLLIVFALIITSFDFGPESFSYSREVDLKNFKKLKAAVSINAGTLNLSSHSSTLAKFNSTYSKSNWQAKLSVDKAAGSLTIRQPEENNNNMKDGDRNDWKIQIPNTLPTEIALALGAGDGSVNLSNSKLTKLNLDAGAGSFSLNLSNTSLTELDVNAGVGSLTVDISGKQADNLNATINGGIGEITLVFPREAAIRVNVNGLGNLEREGFVKKNGYYVNNNSGKSQGSIDVTVNGGLGKVKLKLK